MNGTPDPHDDEATHTNEAPVTLAYAKPRRVTSSVVFVIIGVAGGFVVVRFFHPLTVVVSALFVLAAVAMAERGRRRRAFWWAVSGWTVGMLLASIILSAWWIRHTKLI